MSDEMIDGRNEDKWSIAPALNLDNNLPGYRIWRQIGDMYCLLNDYWFETEEDAESAMTCMALMMTDKSAWFPVYSVMRELEEW